MSSTAHIEKNDDLVNSNYQNTSRMKREFLRKRDKNPQVFD